MKEIEKTPKKVSLKERRKIIISLFRWLVWDIGLERAQERFLGKKWVASRRVARNRRRAIRFRENALQLGGVLIKLGQYLSSRFDILPEEWLEELSKLQDAVPAVDFAELKIIIEQDLGGPVEELFERINVQPLASASLGQVHEAWLKDGTHVAVKVLRPGISAIIEADLEAMNRVIDFLSRRTDLGKLADLKGIAREFDRTLRRELDYVKEAESAEIIRKNLENLKYVYVPQVYSEYSSVRVLTTEFVEGIKVNNLAAIEAAGIDRDRAARILANCYLNQILIDGYFHADPHPGNLFLRYGADGGVQVVFIDFGMIGEISPVMKASIRKLVYGIMGRNTEQSVEALRELNFIKKEENVDKIKVAVSFLIDRVLGLNLGQLKDGEFRKSFNDLNYIIYSNPVYLPADFSFLSRAMETLIGVCTNLSPKLNFTEETKPFLRRLLEEEVRNEEAENGVEGFLTSRFGQELRNTALELLTLPRTINKTLGQLENGRVQIQSQSEEIRRLNERQSRTERIMSGVVAGSVLVSGALVAALLRRNGNGNGHSNGNGHH